MAATPARLGLKVFENMPRRAAQFKGRLSRHRLDVRRAANAIGAEDFLFGRHAQSVSRPLLIVILIS